MVISHETLLRKSQKEQIREYIWFETNMIRLVSMQQVDQQSTSKQYAKYQWSKHVNKVFPDTTGIMLWTHLHPAIWHNTVKCPYNVVQNNMKFHTALCWLKQSINKSVKSQITPHISP